MQDEKNLSEGHPRQERRGNRARRLPPFSLQLTDVGELVIRPGDRSPISRSCILVNHNSIATVTRDRCVFLRDRDRRRIKGLCLTMAS